jgi:hypothetical protein
MSELNSSLAEIKDNRKPFLSIVAGNDAPTSLNFLFAKYRRTLARWHVTKSEVDRKAVREAYRKWAVNFLGEADDPFVAAEAERISA